MSELLFVNACIRGEKSRTLALARQFLDGYAAAHPEDRIAELDLCALRLDPQYPEVLAQRDALWEAGRLDHPVFGAARQFAQADKIVVAAPFWDLAFPAVLRIYLERVCVVNITFGYSDSGASVGRCRAEKLLYVTTRGGNFSLPETAPLEMGARHLQALCTMFGIPQFDLLCAEGLDDVRNDKEALMAEAMARGMALAKTF